MNVGARIKGRLAPTKKALKEAMATNPADVEFFTTATLFDGIRTINGSDVHRERETLYVVGPDPEHSRRWYATVKAGKVA